MFSFLNGTPVFMEILSMAFFNAGNISICMILRVGRSKCFIFYKKCHWKGGG
jgi:hypothetical protein